MTPFLLALPWVGVLLFLLLIARVPRELPGAESRPDGERPFVSVIVPARKEAPNIEKCLLSLTASTYPAFEVIVVDDRSDDDTAERAASVPDGNARSLRVIDGAELPDGWVGKPWACHQGAAAAEGELLLFTDADTTHGADLLARAVAGLHDEAADLLTVIGRQLMETFWERLVQPQIFLAMLFRFPDFEGSAKNRRWRDAIANGQFILFPRASYNEIGGHEAVRDEVVEDLALAQRVKRAGLGLRIRSAGEDLATRMYRSLGDPVEGWSKNLVIGGIQSVAPMLRLAVAPVARRRRWPLDRATRRARGLAHRARGGGTAYLGRDGLRGERAHLRCLHPRDGRSGGVRLPLSVGGLVATYIFARSWRRGRTVEWKGRRYTVPAASERA